MGKTHKQQILNDFRLTTFKGKRVLKHKTRQTNKGIKGANKNTARNLGQDMERLEGRNHSEWGI